jgi:hypothetical protein
VHATIVRVSTGEQDISTATIVGEEMLRWLRDLDGFVGSMMLSRPGRRSPHIWESAEVAERHRTCGASSATDHCGRGRRIEEVEEFEVTFAHVAALMVGT